MMEVTHIEMNKIYLYIATWQANTPQSNPFFRHGMSCLFEQIVTRNVGKLNQG